MSSELEKLVATLDVNEATEGTFVQANEVLRGNTFGILEDEGTTEEKIGRLLALLPVAFQIVDEARETIARLRDENERLTNGSD